MDTPFTIMPADDTPGASNEPTILAQLKKVIEGSVKRPDIFVEVPERPGVTVRVSPNVTQHQLKSWRKNAGEESKSGMDTLKFACSVIGHTTTGIAFNGEMVIDGNGYEVNFASPEILEMTKTTRALPDCVRAFFGLEPHVEAAAVAIMEASGYGDSVETMDPTKGSSNS